VAPILPVAPIVARSSAALPPLFGWDRRYSGPNGGRFFDRVFHRRYVLSRLAGQRHGNMKSFHVIEGIAFDQFIRLVA
jgi:hypothetical protein